MGSGERLATFAAANLLTMSLRLGEQKEPDCEWCRREELNLRPTDYESVALPTELLRLWDVNCKTAIIADIRRVCAVRRGYNRTSALSTVFTLR